MKKIGKVPLVSIIIATYRRESELTRALNSVEKLNYSNYEVILVDDNDDNIWNGIVQKIVEKFRDTNKNISVKYIANHPNLGSARTRNVGIDLADGEYICFLDDDDIYLPERVENQLEPMMETGADYSITDLALYNEKNKLIEIRKRMYIKNTMPEKLFQYHLMYHMTGTDTLMFRKNYLNKIGKFDPIDLGDEFYLMSKAILEGGKFLYVPSCDVKAYVHSEGGGLSSGKEKIEGENQLYIHKKQYFAQLDKKSVRYIKTRHYIVLAYAYLKSKQYVDFLKYGIKSFVISPTGAISILIHR